VLHIVQTVASLRIAKGGVSRTVTQLSRSLARQADTRVSLISADSAAGHDIESLRRGSPPGLDFLPPGRIFGDVRRRATKSDASSTVVHDNGVWQLSNLLAAVAAYRARVPLIISPHGMLEPWCLSQRRLRKTVALATYQGWCLRAADAIHATSAEEAENVRRLGLQQPIAVVGNGIDSPPPDFLLTSGTHRTALFLSRLHPKKGALELVAAWRQVCPSGWSLRIVGPDEAGHRQKIVAAIANSGAADSIELCDGADEAQKWQHFSQAELFILPTFSENFGLVIGEALACGLPVITTNATPWKPIEDHGCGWVIDPTVEAIAAALRAATSLPPTALRNMGAQGRLWIPREFSWDQIARRMHELYTWVTRACPSGERPGFVRAD
jgi:glycosyltransferase involved in cell wall biosynthesis